MTVFDKCKNSTVLVNQGSGVVIQPMITEYAYVLTAKHVIRDSKNEDINVIDVNGKSIGVTDKFEHPTLDIAIIQIQDAQEVVISKCFDKPINKEEYIFYGYPKSRRNKSKQQKEINLQLLSYDGLKIICRNDDFSGQQEIEGMSGGGVYKIIDDNKVYLTGIQCRMDAENPIETHNHVQVISIDAFDEIIKTNGLAEILPPYVNNFDELIEDTYRLNNATSNRDLLRSSLHSIARTHIINNFRPKQLFDIKKPLLEGVSDSEISNLTLWVNYLEFLIFTWCVKDELVFDMEILNSMSKKYCFLFGNNTSWTALAEDIYKSDLSDLEIGGTIFVSCEGDKTPNVYKLHKDHLSNISHVPQDMNISNGIVDPISQLSVKHIFYIEKKLLDLSIEGDITLSNVRKKIAEKLNGS